MVPTPTATERTPRGQGELLRERLVDAALEMIDAGEGEAISIRSVTKQAGVSPTAFYLHFENLELLVSACVDRCFAEFRDQVRTAAGTNGTPRERLLRAGLSYIDFAERRAPRYALIFGAGAPTLAPNPRQADATDHPGPGPAADDAFDDLLLLVEAHLPPDDPRRSDLNILAKGIWSGLHGFVTLCRSRPGMDWPEAEQFSARLAEAWLGEPTG